jgi:hypothetical protein
VGTLVNEKLTKLFENPKYADLSDDKKEEKITQFVDKAKIVGRAKFILLQTEGLPVAEEKALLAAFKKDKLMSEQVFDEYKKFRNGE